MLRAVGVRQRAGGLVLSAKKMASEWRDCLELMGYNLLGIVKTECGLLE